MLYSWLLNRTWQSVKQTTMQLFQKGRVFTPDHESVDQVGDIEDELTDVEIPAEMTREEFEAFV